MKGVMELLRWTWAQLTSMRTALFLLFLLALAAIPGSMVPQRSVSPIRVLDFKAANPGLDKWFEPLGLYNVYSSPWFSAVYILLFVSLIGCILPRIAVYLRAVRTPPPRLPKRMNRLPGYALVAGADESSLDAAESWLKRHRFRVLREAATDEGPAGLRAERGYLREAGNLAFHLALVFVLIGVAWSNLFGFRGTAVIVEGQAFSNTITQYDDFSAGALVNTDQLTAFTLQLNKFTAKFEEGPVQTGAAREFRADVDLTVGGETNPGVIEVNHPLELGETKVHVIGHGYAANVTVKDGNGDVAFSGPVVFLPQDGNFTSTGVIKVPDARPQRLAFQGSFLPTSTGMVSVFPDALRVRLVLTAWSGDPKEETGVPENVYTLNTTGLTQVMGDDGQALVFIMSPGGGGTLPDNLGSITFDGWSRWVKVQVSDTPGVMLALIAILVAILGISASLFIRPRRLWVKVGAEGIEVGGLDRADATVGLDEDVAALVDVMGGKAQRQKEDVL